MVSGPVNLIAYLRVSSEAQDTQLQRDALGEAGCTKFFEDKISSRQPDRPGLSAAMEYLRRGDTLVVWKLDRLGRSVKDVVGRGKWFCHTFRDAGRVVVVLSGLWLVSA